MKLFLPIAIAIMILAGCGDKRKTYEVSEDQMQTYVNAVVALRAAIKVFDTSTAGAFNLLVGAEGFLTGGLTNVEDLPAAQFDQKELEESYAAQEDFREKGEDAKKNPAPGVDAGIWVAVGSAVLAALAAAYRYRGVIVNLPGVGPLIGTAMEAGYAFAPQRFKDKLASGEQKAMAAMRQAVQYGHAVELIASLDPEARAKLEELKDKARKLARDKGLDPLITAVLADVRANNELTKS